MERGARVADTETAFPTAEHSASTFIKSSPLRLFILRCWHSGFCVWSSVSLPTLISMKPEVGVRMRSRTRETDVTEDSDARHQGRGSSSEEVNEHAKTY